MHTYQTSIINRWDVSSKEKVGGERFFNHMQVDYSSILSTHALDSSAVSGKHLLCIGDTTSFSFSHLGRLQANDQAIGRLEDNQSIGYFVHPNILLDASNGLALGYGSVQMWSRPLHTPPRKGNEYKKLPIEDKESFRWLSGIEATRLACPTASQITCIHDRESDIYELFARIPDARTQLIVRSSWDRLLATGELLQTHLDALVGHPTDVYSLEVPASRHRHKRKATMAVKYTQVTLQKPKNKAALLPNDPDTVQVYVLEATEVGEIPAGEKPIHWRILTTHPITNFWDACQILVWYTYRWWIEDLFRLLKTEGFQIEKSQLSTGHALQNLTATTLITALQVLNLRQVNKMQDIQTPAALCLDEDTIDFLESYQTQMEGKTTLQQNPYPTRSLLWASWLIARIGGWNPHSKKNDPKRTYGVTTLIRGMQRLQQKVDGWKWAKQNSNHNAKAKQNE